MIRRTNSPSQSIQRVRLLDGMKMGQLLIQHRKLAARPYFTLDGVKIYAMAPLELIRMGAIIAVKENEFEVTYMIK